MNFHMCWPTSHVHFYHLTFPFLFKKQEPQIIFSCSIKHICLSSKIYKQGGLKCLISETFFKIITLVITGFKIWTLESNAVNNLSKKKTSIYYYLNYIGTLYSPCSSSEEEKSSCECLCCSAVIVTESLVSYREFFSHEMSDIKLGRK